MGNTIITPQVIAKEALMQLENNLILGRLCHTDYKKEFVKKGSTVSIRTPIRFVASDGAARVNQDVSETTTNIVINKQKHVSWNFSSTELTLSVEQYSERYIKPAMIAIANQIETNIAELYKEVPCYTGVAGTTPAAFSTIAGAAQLLDEAAVPDQDRHLVLNPAAKWSMADVIKGYYNPQMIEKAVRQGFIGNIANCLVYGTQNIQTHTSGTGADTSGTPLCDTVGGATFTGSTLNTDGWGAADTLKVGDRFTIANVYSVNPHTRVSTGSLKRFIVTAAKTCTGTTSDDAITISPAIVTSGAYQNVNAAPANNAAIQTIDSTPDAGVEANYVANLMFHKNAFALVMVPMELPDGAPFKARQSYNNYSVRVIKDYDIDTDKEIIRLDVLYGVKCIYPELACVLMG